MQKSANQFSCELWKSDIALSIFLGTLGTLAVFFLVIWQIQSG